MLQDILFKSLCPSKTMITYQAYYVRSLTASSHPLFPRFSSVIVELRNFRDVETVSTGEAEDVDTLIILIMEIS